MVHIFHDRNEIEHFLRGNIYLHIYSIGDLDDFFWPYTIWYGSKDDGGIAALALLYVGQPLPVLIALSDPPEELADLARSMLHLLPCRFYAHLSPGVEAGFREGYSLEPHGEHFKMALVDRAAASRFDPGGLIGLGQKELAEILGLYEASYPGNWFDPRMLETGQYFGLREEGRLVSVGGIHVYSPRYAVAALGNVATHPLYRGRGYGKAVSARVCRSLLDTVEHIGLNVKADNRAAVACYERLGFEKVASYGEFMVSRVRA